MDIYILLKILVFLTIIHVALCEEEAQDFKTNHNRNSTSVLLNTLLNKANQNATETNEKIELLIKSVQIIAENLSNSEAVPGKFTSQFIKILNTYRQSNAQVHKGKVQLEARINQIENNVENLFKNIEVLITSINGKVDGVEKQLNDVKLNSNTRIIKVETNTGNLEQKINQIIESLKPKPAPVSNYREPIVCRWVMDTEECD